MTTQDQLQKAVKELRIICGKYHIKKFHYSVTKKNMVTIDIELKDDHHINDEFCRVCFNLLIDCKCETHE